MPVRSFLASWSTRTPYHAFARWTFRLTPLVAVVLAAGCATNPVTGKKQVALMSEAQEIEMGRQADQQVRQEMGIYDDPEMQQYVERLGLELAHRSHRPHLPWSFAIVDAAAINAFALPGGPVYVTRGLLAFLGSEAELVGVLGHEIGHVTARHSVEHYTRSAGAGIGLTVASIFFPGVAPFSDFASMGLGMLFMKYGRDDELQADRLGAEYAAQGGWDPAGVAGMLRTLSRLDEVNGGDRRGVPGWLSTHPAPGARVEEVQTAIETARTRLEGGTGRVQRDDYLRQVDGLVFGEHPREGVVRGRAFLHSDLRFALEFPEGWDIANMPEQVVANQAGTKHYVVLDMVRDHRNVRSLGEVALQTMRSRGFRQIGDGSEQRFNGLDGWVGTFDGKVQDIGEVRARVALVQHERNLYRLLAFAPRESFGLIAADATATFESFRGLSRDEARDIRPNRVDLYTVREGDTWQSIAQRAGEDNVRASTLAILNGFPPAEQPRPGDRIKIVVAG